MLEASPEPSAPRNSAPSRLSDWHQRFVVEERVVSPSVRRRTYAFAAVLVSVGFVGFLILLVAVTTRTGFERLDEPVELWFNAQRSTDATGFMIGLAIVFGPIALPIVVVITLVAWIIAARHLWRPILLFAGMVTGVVVAQTLAPIVQHPRPPIGLMLFGPDRSFSFPSGHVLGTSNFLLILAYLLASRIGRRWFTVAAIAVAIVGIVLQVISRLYLGYHWISDTTASICISLVIVGVLIAVDTRRTVLIPGEPVRGPLSQLQKDGT
ncbi:phosphatase PAP2 family protein [Naasia lichenicola]|uniref:Phosphatase PAP2 family protein n=1 Tax=Naasia lichenicola TaxID=2565933 RepID=A0A4S4FI34_9MICO|nr:phosphatase PAP2 family protein [Naasia lichenicola]THG29970.1 phosphatase PAP2 family protein [Naasia lichenicola]